MRAYEHSDCDKPHRPVQGHVLGKPGLSSSHDLGTIRRHTYVPTYWVSLGSAARMILEPYEGIHTYLPTSVQTCTRMHAGMHTYLRTYTHKCINIHIMHIRAYIDVYTKHGPHMRSLYMGGPLRSSIKQPVRAVVSGRQKSWEAAPLLPAWGHKHDSELQKKDLGPRLCSRAEYCILNC